MLELMLCSMLTVLPDYLYRRFVQGKRLGREITLFSVWYELRWGITLCLILTLSLITTIFYFHPSTNSVNAAFRTVTILPDRPGRVAELFVRLNDVVEEGQPLFRLDTSEQEAKAETARRQIAEVDAEITVAQAQLAEADGRIAQARGALQQAIDEYETRAELQRRDAGAIASREVDRARVNVDTRQGEVDAVIANKEVLSTQLDAALPARKATAEAALEEAQIAIDKSLVRAGVTGRVQQFVLRVGDFVNPFVRPAGILVPAEAGRAALVAGFGQIEAQVLKVGMIAEATCIGKPFTIIPMVVTQVQHVIAAGQVRPTDALVDVQQIAQPGTLTVFLEPLFAGGLDGVPPGSSCIANAYTSNHEALQSEDLGALERFGLHALDAVGIVHALILRMQALLLPVQTLVLGGH